MLKTITGNKWRAAAFALAATVAIGHISSLSGSHSWLFEDFAQHLIHARNIAELKHYACRNAIRRYFRCCRHFPQRLAIS